MKIYFDQIPEGVDIRDYPSDTVFVLDDSKPKRDPVTYRLIRGPERPMLYPENVRRMNAERQK